jgi:predicted DCC family thiol-disulfide oxidoreductase YuxK
MIILLFDGDCYLCQNSIQFVIQRDFKKVIHFASLQSEFGQRLLEKKGYVDVPNSLVLLDQDKLFLKSEAVLQLIQHFSWKWRALALLKWIPRCLRDAVYDWVARHRYQWFGKADQCLLPTPDLKSRFLD